MADPVPPRKPSQTLMGTVPRSNSGAWPPAAVPRTIAVGAGATGPTAAPTLAPLAPAPLPVRRTSSVAINIGSTASPPTGAAAVPVAIPREPTMSTAPSGQVSVGLLEGRSRLGQVRRFDPTTPSLLLETPAPVPGQRADVVAVPMEGIAYVAFFKGSGTYASAADTVLPEDELKVHVPGGKVFLVVPRSTPPATGLGFFADPVEVDSPFSLIFFYERGINAREQNQPLGVLLMEEGLTADDLARVLDVQEANRRIPIGEILVELHKVSPEAVAHARELQQRRSLRLGELLVQEGVVTPQQIDLALAEQKKRKGRRLGELLVDLGVIQEDVLARTLSKKFHMPFVDLDRAELDPEAAKAIPIEMLERYRVLPLQVNHATGTATIAISDPLAVDAIDALRFHMRKQITEVLVTRSQLARYVDTVLDDLRPPPDEMGSILRDLSVEDLDTVKDATAEREGSTVRESDSAVIRLANQIIIEAYRRGASDIHIEPNGRDQDTVVRFRIDGDCEDYQQIPPPFRLPLVARLKIMAGLDISERRKPQDGKIRLKLPSGQLELRVATIPTANGNEDVVLRILAGAKPLPLPQIGLTSYNLDRLKVVIEKPYGLILCAGPTGSGKTTTLHSILGALNTPDRKIWTAEDPVEICQPRLRQVQVLPKIGFTFAAAMRAFLRADPDVIMIGEMRDEETAGTAVEASLTGHLVLSTLHTNSAPETITRLVDMGIDPFSFGDALLGVLAQRLARTLCLSCREIYHPTEDEFTRLAQSVGAEALAAVGMVYDADLRFWRGAGCEGCRGSGYKGRVGLHELLVADDALKQAVQSKASIGEIRAVGIRGGMRTLLQDGLEKVMQGITDLQQVLAVCIR